MADEDQVYTGRCFCGEVEVQAAGAPFAMGYCHCADCRSWAAAPVNAFTLWQPGTVKVTKGEGSVGTFAKTENSQRKFCTKCGGHVMNDHPGPGFVDVYAATLPELEFQPQLHVNYGSTVLRMKDGLPKYEDFPKDFGGSGKELPE